MQFRSFSNDLNEIKRSNIAMKTMDGGQKHRKLSLKNDVFLQDCCRYRFAHASEGSFCERVDLVSPI